MMKKLLYVLVLCGVLLSLASCSEKTPIEIDEDAFLIRAKDVLSRADTLNEIFFEEKGLPLRAVGFSSGNYKEVDVNLMAALGFQGIGDLKAENSEIFSKRESLFNEQYVFSPETLTESGVSATRFQRYFVYNNPGNESDKNNGKLLAYTGEEEYLSDPVTLHTNSIKIVEAAKNNRTGETYVMVTVDESVTSGEKIQRQTALTFRFVLEDGKWKLDTSVSLVYNENYNENEK